MGAPSSGDWSQDRSGSLGGQRDPRTAPRSIRRPILAVRSPITSPEPRPESRNLATQSDWQGSSEHLLFVTPHGIPVFQRVDAPTTAPRIPMETERRCPRCGNPLPREISQAACPSCLLRAGLAPESETTPPEAGDSYQVTMGFEPAHPGRVLEAIAHSIGSIPRVLLPDTQPDDRGVRRDRAVVARNARARRARRSLRALRRDRPRRNGCDPQGSRRRPRKGPGAVKVLLEAHTDKPDLLRRFVEEAQIGGQLQHPGIVPVYELGTLPTGGPTSP